MESKPAHKAKLGELLVQQGFITEHQLQQMLAVQKKQNTYKPLGEICTDLGFISRLSLSNILAKYQKQILLGDLLVNMGLVTEEQITEALKVQRVTGRRLGQILVEKGFVTRSGLADSLSMQLGIPKIVPNVSFIDETLLEGVNPSFFQTKRVVPVCNDTERGVLTVLMDDPLDTETISDLEKVYKIEIEPAISATGELDYLLQDIFSPASSPSVSAPRAKVESLDEKNAEVRTSAPKIDISSPIKIEFPCDQAMPHSTTGLKFKVEEPPAESSGEEEAVSVPNVIPIKFKHEEPVAKPIHEKYTTVGQSSLKFTSEESAAEPVPEKGLVVSGNVTHHTVSRDNTVGIFDFIVSSAVKEGASDIHIEPLEKRVRVRFRIDGLLRHKTDLPKSSSSSLTTRIKALCGLDIAERRRHQDGRIEARIADKDVDLRVSTYAALWGENVVIRILHRQTNLVDINKIGLSPLNLERYQRLLNYPSGVMLVTGPTGSGKTTTLYASLLYLNDMERKIITVEDPIEYTIDGVIQGKLDPKLHMTYEDFIKSMMRQDPDVIMIGEIRDEAGAGAAIQAALTGHKVFSTFHTDDTTSGLLRLMNMGIETFLISSTVLAILAQRLVRNLCPSCKEPGPPPPHVLSAFHSIKWTGTGNGMNFFRPKGCPDCNHTGYKGRSTVQELLEINDPVRESILEKNNSSQIRVIAREQAKLISMAEDGFYKAAKGHTTLEEILRVVHINASDALFPYGSEQIVELCDGREDGEPHPVLRTVETSAA